MKLRGFLVCAAPMVGGIIVGAKTPLLSPLLYALSRVNKNICLIGFIVYCLAICFEVYVNSVYSIDYTTVFAIVLPSILLLDRCLSERDYDTVELAKMCDDLGYHRYWCAEHHATPGYASPCPEMMAAHVACATKNIRAGTGGVMLTHYSPFKEGLIKSSIS